MLLGTMAHLAVLEPQKLDTAFVERPEGIDLRTKLGKEWKESVGTMPVLDQDEARAVRGIRDSIAAHSAARELLAGTKSEVSLFGDSRNGLAIKGRVDAMKEGVLVDVKTTSAGADANAFSRQSFALNYHVSAAWYYYLATLNDMPSQGVLLDRGGDNRAVCGCRLRDPHSGVAAWLSPDDRGVGAYRPLRGRGQLARLRQRGSDA
jgi:hypothetical protein